MKVDALFTMVGVMCFSVTACDRPVVVEQELQQMPAVVSVDESSQPWQNNRLTKDQPFPAQVIGVADSWVGFALLLEEIGVESPRCCSVMVTHTSSLNYVMTTREEEMKGSLWRWLPEGVPVSSFSHEGLLYKIGAIYGEEDVLMTAISRTEKEKNQAEERGR